MSFLYSEAVTCSNAVMAQTTCCPVPCKNDWPDKVKSRQQTETAQTQQIPWTSLDIIGQENGTSLDIIGHETQLNSRRNRANLGRSHPQREPNLIDLCNGWVSQGDDTDTKDTERHGYRLMSCDETCNTQAQPFNLSTFQPCSIERLSPGILKVFPIASPSMWSMLSRSICCLTEVVFRGTRTFEESSIMSQYLRIEWYAKICRKIMTFHLQNSFESLHTRNEDLWKFCEYLWIPEMGDLVVTCWWRSPVVPWWSPVVQDVGSVGSFGLDSWERPLWRETRVVCGVDEAGRGPLAGPVPWKKTNEKSTKGGTNLVFWLSPKPIRSGNAKTYW